MAKFIARPCPVKIAARDAGPGYVVNDPKGMRYLSLSGHATFFPAWYPTDAVFDVEYAKMFEPLNLAPPPEWAATLVVTKQAMLVARSADGRRFVQWSGENKAWMAGRLTKAGAWVPEPCAHCGRRT